MINKIFFSLIGFSIVVSVLLLNLEIISPSDFNSSLAAIGLNLINTFVALRLFDKSIDKNNKLFLMLNLGGMGIRMIFILISVVLFIKIFHVQIYSFLLIFFVFYFILLSLEVYNFSNKLKEKNLKKSSDL